MNRYILLYANYQQPLLILFVSYHLFWILAAASAALRHCRTPGGEGREVSFDGLEYIASYGDLISAFGADSKAGTEHFILAGRDQGREVDFDSQQYLDNYADL